MSDVTFPPLWMQANASEVHRSEKKKPKEAKKIVLMQKDDDDVFFLLQSPTYLPTVISEKRK